MLQIIIHTDDNDKFNSIEIFAPHNNEWPMAMLSTPSHEDEQGFIFSFDGANDWYMGDDRVVMDERIRCILLARAIALTGGEALKNSNDYTDHSLFVEKAYASISAKDDAEFVVVHT